jgi:hypothetical protein
MAWRFWRCARADAPRLARGVLLGVVGRISQVFATVRDILARARNCVAASESGQAGNQKQQSYESRHVIPLQ